MENHDHLERPATSQHPFQRPQVASAHDQLDNDTHHRAVTEDQPTPGTEGHPASGTTSAQCCDDPQEKDSTASMDLMQTMIRASQGDADAQVALGDRYKK
ncbi:hypothetical protein BGZ95_009018, partial [Linnemannia exigua]